MRELAKLSLRCQMIALGLGRPLPMENGLRLRFDAAVRRAEVSLR